MHSTFLYSVRHGWRTVAQWLLAFTLIVPPLLVVPATPVVSLEQPVVLSEGESINWSTAAKIDPRLVQFAVEQPGQGVRVIVQKLTQNQELEKLVAQLHGTVVTDLHIINAFAADMSADAAYQLAQHPAVRWISIDAPVLSSSAAAKDEPSPKNYYLDTLGIPAVSKLKLDGKGIGVAVVDSGITSSKELKTVEARLNYNGTSTTADDVYGHGTHVAGIIASKAKAADGTFAGIASAVTLISVKISDAKGMGYESDAVAALQWIYENRAQYNIRVVNLSINSTQESTYHASPLNAAAEVLWFNGIVVVASAGNRGSASAHNPINAAPANDPFIITVGASDEKGDSTYTNDIVAPFTAFGTTQDGHTKPDIVAPGTAIYSVLSEYSQWDSLYADRCAEKCKFFRLSGTSMAAPMVTGVVALMLQKEPGLTPDQVKYRLVNSTGRRLSATLGASTFSFPYMDGYAAVTAKTSTSANMGLQASQLLWTGNNPANWNSVNWNSVNWNSVNWNSVNWNSTVLERSPDAVVVAGSEEEFMWEVPAWPQEDLEPDAPQLDNHIFLPVLRH